MMVFDENVEILGTKSENLDNVKSLLEEILSTVWDKVNDNEENQDTFGKVPKKWHIQNFFTVFIFSVLSIA